VSVLNGQKETIIARLVDLAEARLDRIEQAPTDPAGRSRVLTATARQIVQEFQAERIDAGIEAVDEVEERELAAAIVARLHGTAGIMALLADESLENINCYGWEEVWVRRAGAAEDEEAAPIVTSDEELVEMVRALAADAGAGGQERRFDHNNPILDQRLPDGSRLHAAMDVSGRPTAAIRKHRIRRATWDELRALGMFSPAVGDFLAALVRARANLVICGRTGVGKTTFLRALISLLLTEHIVTIEDTWELDLRGDGRRFVTPLQARQPNIEGAGEITMAALFRSALRQNPSRVIVGENRGDEVVPMLHSMNQGNDGSLSTIHASSSLGAFSKLQLFGATAPERLDRAAMAQLIADGVDFVVHLDQTRDGVRVVSSIREVVGADGEMVVSNEIARPDADRRAVPVIAPDDAWIDRLAEFGWSPDAWGQW
jgi:pilus assembly protein CpaF